jgi:hypothetical protein
VRRQLGPNQIPKWIGILIIVGVILMFVGMVVINSAEPTDPPPDRPPEANPGHEDYDPSSDEYEDYYEALSEWNHDNENNQNHRDQTFQMGAIIHNIGVLLAALPMVIGALFLSNLDMGMRKVLVIMGIVLLIVMFMVPLAWQWM